MTADHRGEMTGATSPPEDSAAPEADAGGLSDSAPDGAPEHANTCPSAPRTDPRLGLREACAFKGGDRASTTLDLSPAERASIPIKHVIVLMKENRAFDHIFGGLKALQPDADVATASFVNKDAADASVSFFHETTTCVGFDPAHQWAAMHSQVNGGKMDGFVRSAAESTGGDGHFVMGHYEQGDLPFYYFLANTFAIADRYFPSVRSGTYPNRDYLLLGTSDKVTATQYTVWPAPTLPTIFDELSAAKVSWGVYADDFPFEGALDDPSHDWATMNPWGDVAKIFTDLKEDTLPGVAFVDGRANVDDEHPTADVQVGEAWTKRIYDAVVASKAWRSTAILLTYDEAGGFADHVPPSSSACRARPEDSAFFELGVRVPLIAISPWARRHYVSHVPKEHTSITRFVESIFDLPALTARDANSDALLDMFDFACPPADVPAAPDAGTNGCGGGATIEVDKPVYSPGDTITVTFNGGPGDPDDWIAVYPDGTTPESGATLWNYCATNSHTATTAKVTSGTVTLSASSASSASSWPLSSGTSWTAYYLVNGGYAAAASVQFDVQN